jgi:hypothetical protein
MWSLQSNAADHEAKYNAADAWKFACELEGCPAGLDPPKVVEWHSMDSASGEVTICGTGLIWGLTPYINPTKMVVLCADTLYYSDPVFVQSVLAHEMTHYIIDAKASDAPVDSCYTEWEGHRVGNAYVYSHGHKEWADYDWYQWYGCYQGDKDGNNGLDFGPIQAR